MIERQLIAGGEPRPLVVFDPRGRDRDPARAGDARRGLPLRRARPGGRLRPARAGRAARALDRSLAADLARGARADRGLRPALRAADAPERVGRGRALGDRRALPAPLPAHGCGPGSFLVTPSGTRRAAAFRVSGCFAYPVSGPGSEPRRAGGPPRERPGRAIAPGGSSSPASRPSPRSPAVQWASLVAHPPAGRVIFAVLLATGAGALLAAIARLEPRGPPAGRSPPPPPSSVLCAGMVVVGLPARLLLPGHWDELGAQHQPQPERSRRRPGSLFRRRHLDAAGDPAGRAAARGPRRLRRLLADPPPGGRADRRAGAARRALPGCGRLGHAIPAAGRRRAPPRARLRLALAAGHLHGPPLRGRHRRQGRGAGRTAGRRRARHRARPARLPPLGAVQRERPELRLGPDLRPARLAAEGDPAPAGLERAHALLEGDQPQHLRRHPLAPLLGRRRASPPSASRSSSTRRRCRPGPTRSTSTGSTSSTAG